MEVRLKPETESRLNELASQSGRPADELVEEAMTAYLSEVADLRSEVADLRSALDTRYEETEGGRENLVDGERFFENLRRSEDEQLKRRSPK